MSAPDTCPKCEAGNKRWDFRTGSGYNYACGTLFEESTKKCVESRFCITAQRDQLATELQAIRAASAALVERVHAAEAVLTDPHALWGNWLRGAVKLPSGIGDIRECSDKMKRFRSRWLAAHQELRKAEERVKRLEEAGDQMAAWLCEPRNLGAAPFMADEWAEAKGQS